MLSTERQYQLKVRGINFCSEIEKFSNKHVRGRSSYGDDAAQLGAAFAKESMFIDLARCKEYHKLAVSLRDRSPGVLRL